jgi:hypothetical protein
MKTKGTSNFHAWMEEMKKQGKIKSEYPEFQKDGDLAELIGVVLGDGHIQKFPRTERLMIFSNSDNHGFVQRYEKSVRKIFQQQPYGISRINQTVRELVCTKNTLANVLVYHTVHASN